jgi:ubiquinone/menaquinone biosynthesis C-methylase UbiE
VAFLASAAILFTLGVVWRRRHPRAFPGAFSFLLDLPLRDVVLARSTLPRRLELAPGMRVLEIGPGSGFYTGALVGDNADVTLTCLDLQPAMLQKLRRRLGARTPHLVCGSASELPFRDGSFDRITLMSVLGEVPDRSGALRECARTLSEDGRLLVAEALPDADYIAPVTLAREGTAAGLVPLEREGRWASYTQRFGRSERPASGSEIPVPSERR